MSDLIDRQAAIATAISGRVRTLPTTEDGEDWIRVNEVRDSLLTLPSAQPTQTNKSNALKSLDCISRQAVIDALNKHSVMFGFHLPHEFHEVKEEIRGLPSAEPRWIPCSERLPEDVLCVTLVTDGIDVWAETWEGIRGKWKYNHSAITAWMPLPEAWKGEEDGGA